MRVQTGPSREWLSRGQEGYKLLEGYRGREPVDNATLEETLLKVSKFLENNPDIKEISLKPIFAYKDGAVAVKSRIILEEDA